MIVSTGGVEMNGPYLALGKHNYILRATTEAIARKLGDALVATIVPFVPEGDINPPSGHMRYRGTISVRVDTFRALVTDIAESLRTHGFDHLILIADSGGNVATMTDVAADLSSGAPGPPFTTSPSTTTTPRCRRCCRPAASRRRSRLAPARARTRFTRNTASTR